MTSGRGHEKRKSHKKTRPSEKLSEASAHEKSKKRPGYEIEILALVIGVAIIGVMYILSVLDYSPNTQNQHEIEEEKTEAETCVERNPSMTEEDCLNMEYIQRAIEENDIGICESITKENLKEHCKRYFGYYRWEG
jgi:cytoskeletal protein RodZ